MTAPDTFDRLIQPRSIAVIGASSNAASVGGQALALLTEFSFHGGVYPVNPKYKTLKDRPCYPDVLSAPKPCDLALIAVSAPQVPAAIEQCGQAGIPFAVVLTAGFQELGKPGLKLQQELEASIDKSGVRVVGPNCIGLLNRKADIRCGFGATMASREAASSPGPLAMVTQSGGFGMSMAGLADDAGLGCSYIVSTGNETDVSALELLSYFLERPDIEAALAYIEGIHDGRQLLELGKKALRLGKPVLLWRVGDTPAGRKAAVSHTGRLTADETLFRLTVREGGFIPIDDVDDLVDVASLIHGGKRARGRRIGIVTLSGGAGVLMADLCERNDLEVSETSQDTLSRLKAHAPGNASLSNPMDVLSSAYYDDEYASYNRLIAEALSAPDFDQLIVRSPPIPNAPPWRWAEGFAAAVSASRKPVALLWGNGRRSREILDLFPRWSIPCFSSPRRAVRALAGWCDFSVKAERFSARSGPGPRPIEALPLPLPVGATSTLGERESKAVLASYGIRVLEGVLLGEAEIEALRSPPTAFPVAVKIESADIPHKTEAGAVRLGISDMTSLKAAAREVIAAARRFQPGARIDGLCIQPMLSGTELIAGAVSDEQYGPVVLIGLGGIFAEALGDVTHRLAPFDFAEARSMIEELRGRAVLDSFRGRLPSDVDAVTDTLHRLSWLISDHRERIVEIDINPLFVGAAGEGAIAADALVVLRKAPKAQP